MCQWQPLMMIQRTRFFLLLTLQEVENAIMRMKNWCFSLVESQSQKICNIFLVFVLRELKIYLVRRKRIFFRLNFAIASLRAPQWDASRLLFTLCFFHLYFLLLWQPTTTFLLGSARCDLTNCIPKCHNFDAITFRFVLPVTAAAGTATDQFSLHSE